MDPRRVIRTYLTITGLFTLSASLIWGINTLFLLEAGLSIFEVFVANAAFTAAMALFEVPTGVVADTRGRRISFLFSASILAVGTLAYVAVEAIGGGVILFSLAGVILGLGFTFYSGAVEAWLVDALRATDHPGELDRVFARSQSVFWAATLIGTVGGGALGQLDLSLPYVVRAGLLIAAFVVSGFFFWAWYAWQPYFLELLGRNLVWVSGVIAALFSLAGILGNSLVGRVAVPGRRRTSILIWGSAITTVAMVLVGVVQIFWVAVPLFLLGAVATSAAVALYAMLRRRGEPTDRIAEAEAQAPAAVG